MKKYTTLGLTVAVALSAGGLLVQHPPVTKGQAPGAYSDITIAEADNQKVPPESADKTAKPATSANPSTADAPPAVETTPGEKSKGAPERE
jgi:hypothetical protein